MSNIRFVSKNVFNENLFEGEIWYGNRLITRASISKREEGWLVKLLEKEEVASKFEELKFVIPSLIEDFGWKTVVNDYYELFICLVEQLPKDKKIYFKYKNFEFSAKFYGMKELKDSEKEIREEIEKWINSILNYICKDFEVCYMLPIYENKSKLQIGELKITNTGVVDQVNDSVFWTEMLFHHYLNHENRIVQRTLEMLLKNCEKVVAEKHSYNLRKNVEIAIKNAKGKWIRPCELVIQKEE